jgi:hypothetical protein
MITDAYVQVQLDELRNTFVLTHSVDKYLDAIPQENRPYFKPVVPHYQGQAIVTIIIPFYNETWEQLQPTITSLQQCQNHIPHYLFSYCLIQDGWSEAPECMQRGLQNMFPHNQYWAELG